MPKVRIDRTPLVMLSSIAVMLPVALIAQATPNEYASEARSLLAMPAIAEAMQRVEDLDEWSLERLIELTEIPAPPFLEELRGARYAELLEQYGADSVWTDEVGNVIGLRRGRTGERTIGFGGHLDTVFPEGTDVTVRQSGDTLFAPGIGDDTRGIVLVLTVLRAMEDAGIETEDDLLFVGVVGEEGLGDLRGMKHLFAEGAEAPDVWIEVDGGGLARLVTMGLGSVRYRVTFTGPGGHSWGAFGLVNPAHAMSRAGPALPRRRRHAHAQRPSNELQRRAPRRWHVGQRDPVRGVDGGRHALGEPREPGPHRGGFSSRPCDSPSTRRTHCAVKARSSLRTSTGSAIARRERATLLHR